MTTYQTIGLPSDPDEALSVLVAASREGPVLVFKKSPVCSISSRAEAQFRKWLNQRTGPASLKVAEIDVIAEQALARGLTSALGIAHASPQALLFKEGALGWQASHGELSASAFAREVDGT